MMDSILTHYYPLYISHCIQLLYYLPSILRSLLMTSKYNILYIEYIKVLNLGIICAHSYRRGINNIHHVVSFINGSCSVYPLNIWAPACIIWISFSRSSKNDHSHITCWSKYLCPF